jgi:DNA-binding CsgD family transcriptional regulator
MAGDDARPLTDYERMRQAVGSLAHLGPASEIIDHCPAAAALAADLDRVVLSRIENGTLIVERTHTDAGLGNGAGGELRHPPVRLAYPLLECEVLRRREARLVAEVDHSQPARYAFLETLGWRAYVAVPILVNGASVGFLHGDRAPGRRRLAQPDADALEYFAAGFALVFERAVLRRRLRDQRREIRRIAAWAEARSGELSDGEIALSGGRTEEQDRRAGAPELPAEDGLAAHLTPREIDVLRLMSEGKRNGDIARQLFVSEGTVKFHVKNVLRKMQASNRADASARYLRMTLNDAAPLATPTLR